MNKTTIKRQKIFDQYAKNLKSYLDYFSYYIKGFDANGNTLNLTGATYICPLCYNLFFDYKYYADRNCLTLEHNPPQILGIKKASILTCKKCNNTFGKDYDKIVNRLLITESFLSSENQLPIDAKINFNEFSIVSKVTKKDGNIYIQPIEKSNPYAFSQIKKSYANKNHINISLALTAPKWNDYSFGMLKIGYLKAFEIFGYFFADLGNGANIRAVLNKGIPYPCINNGVIDIFATEEMLGIHIVREPKDLQAIILTQKISFMHENIKVEKNIPVILPGPYENSWELLKNYNNYRDKQITITTEKITIPNQPLKNILDYYALFELPSI